MGIFVLFAQTEKMEEAFVIKRDTMAKKLISTTIALVVATIGIFFIYQNTKSDVWLSALITFGTISYHFVMRLFVGAGVNGISEETFSVEKRSLDEIVQATCQSEITHEVIAVLSFLPLLASLKFDSFMVFFITSLLAACFDLSFVIIQRYNRPRLVKLVKKTR